MAPAHAHALLSGGPLYEVQRARMVHNWDWLRKKTIAGLVATAMPVFLCPEEGVADRLRENGILISSFAYPDPEGTLVNRVVLSALHREDDLQRLYQAL